MKEETFEYMVCAMFGIGGVRLAMLMNYLPTPEEAVKAAIIGFISAAAGITMRYVWGRLNRMNDERPD